MGGKGKAGGGPPGGKGGGKGEILEAMKAARAEADAEMAAKTEADRAALIARGIDPEEEAERLCEERTCAFRRGAGGGCIGAGDCSSWLERD